MKECIGNARMYQKLFKNEGMYWKLFQNEGVYWNFSRIKECINKSSKMKKHDSKLRNVLETVPK